MCVCCLCLQCIGFFESVLIREREKERGKGLVERLIKVRG